MAGGASPDSGCGLGDCDRSAGCAGQGWLAAPHYHPQSWVIMLFPLDDIALLHHLLLCLGQKLWCHRVLGLADDSVLPLQILMEE